MESEEEEEKMELMKIAKDNESLLFQNLVYQSICKIIPLA